MKGPLYESHALVLSMCAGLPQRPNIYASTIERIGNKIYNSVSQDIQNKHNLHPEQVNYGLVFLMLYMNIRRNLKNCLKITNVNP